DDDQLAAVSDGRIWTGQEAVAAGLIDAVMTYDDALAELAGGTPLTGASAMPAKPKATKTTPASQILKAKSEEHDDKAKSEEEEDEEMESEETTDETESEEDEE